MSGTCDNCHRQRDDLFFHEQDEAFYCLDVFACQARYYVREERGDFDGWPDSEKSGAHVIPPAAKAPA